MIFASTFVLLSAYFLVIFESMPKLPAKAGASKAHTKAVPKVLGKSQIPPKALDKKRAKTAPVKAQVNKKNIDTHGPDVSPKSSVLKADELLG